jgi:hypothetical protein
MGIALTVTCVDQTTSELRALAAKGGDGAKLRRCSVRPTHAVPADARRRFRAVMRTRYADRYHVTVGRRSQIPSTSLWEHMRLTPAILGLLLAGCATADPVNFANGQAGYAIKCDLGLNGLDQCYRKAGSLCGERGYSLHDWQGNPVTYEAVERDLDQSLSTFSAKTILVQCNP